MLSVSLPHLESTSWKQETILLSSHLPVLHHTLGTSEGRERFSFLQTIVHTDCQTQLQRADSPSSGAFHFNFNMSSPTIFRFPGCPPDHFPYLSIKLLFCYPASTSVPTVRISHLNNMTQTWL
ncbi:hypothetical protein ATANTOWER_002999 [Ataeniobius toweri]|uniref:Uncharacterized protein n=1 Tax=Ataeniobius toweri TaxID=208326 RepID=A0ABU7C8H7_9TELE|nr:hypothetical protein [Ataeniobius toweri]